MQSIQSADAPAAIGPYSQAIKLEDLIFASGQIPLAADGSFVGGDIEAQAEQVLRNVCAVLAAGGASLSDVVKTTVFMQDMDDFAGMNKVYEKAFGAHKPARSTVQVARLRDARVEIEVIARVRR